MTKAKCMWVKHKICDHTILLGKAGNDQNGICDICIKADIAKNLDEIRIGLMQGTFSIRILQM